METFAIKSAVPLSDGMTPPGALSFLETRRRYAPHFFEASKQRCLNKLRRRSMKKPPWAASSTLIVTNRIMMRLERNARLHEYFSKLRRQATVLRECSYILCFWRCGELGGEEVAAAFVV
jgi:hypothetical protein